jgi:hypothetical protein
METYKKTVKNVEEQLKKLWGPSGDQKTGFGA